MKTEKTEPKKPKTIGFGFLKTESYGSVLVSNEKPNHKNRTEPKIYIVYFILYLCHLLLIFGKYVNIFAFLGVYNNTIYMF